MINQIWRTGYHDDWELKWDTNRRKHGQIYKIRLWKSRSVDLIMFHFFFQKKISDVQRREDTISSRVRGREKKKRKKKILFKRMYESIYIYIYIYITQVVIGISTKLDIVKTYYVRNLRINNLNRRQSQFVSELLIMMRTKRLLKNDDAEKLSSLIRRVHDEYSQKTIFVSIGLKKTSLFYVIFWEDEIITVLERFSDKLQINCCPERMTLQDVIFEEI